MTRPYAPGYRIPTDLLLKAYASGVFPMAESASDPEVFWVRPETRGVIPLDAFHVPKSLKKVVRQHRFDIRIDTDFARRHRRLRRGARGTQIDLDQCADPRSLHKAVRAGTLPFGRGLARRAAGRRALWRQARPRVLRREHVLARDRRVEGLPRASGRALEGAGASRCSILSSPPSTSSASARSTCRAGATRSCSRQR